MKIQEANRILEIALTQELEIDKATATKIAKAKKKFMSHYGSDPKAFLEDFVKILHGKTNEECDFILNGAQIALVEAMKKKRWVAAPKARQLGITTLTNGLALHHSIFVSNANVICMAMKTENAQENLRRIKTMFRTMPEWVRDLTTIFDEKKGHLNNQGLWSFHSRITDTSNKLEVATANSEDGTRGKQPTMMHWTETAFSPYAHQIFTSVFPALNRREDSVIVLESTGNGNAGFYYEVCTGIRKGFEVVFMPWFMDVDYTKGGDDLSENDLEYIKDLMGVKEFPPGLTEGQLRWYRDTSEVTGKAKGQQEYPVSVEQVFQATNASFFSFNTMEKVVDKAPIYQMSYEQGFLSKRPLGAGLFYENVDAGKEYLIACDPSEGVIDPCVIGVYGPEGEEVMFWRELMPPETIVELLNSLGKHWNNARLVIEENGIGKYILKTLIHNKFYPNVYRHEGKEGITTQTSTKPLFMSTLQELINTEKMKFFNPHLKGEMAIFQADTLKAPKGEGMHDDCVMQAAIAATVFAIDPPRYKMIQDNFRDYGYQVGESRINKRRFIF